MLLNQLYMMVKNTKKASAGSAQIHLIANLDSINKLKLPSGYRNYVKDNLKKEKLIK